MTPDTTSDRKCYGQHCTVTTALDLAGDRWTLLILRELLGGPARFEELVDGLQGIPRDDWSSKTVADLMESRSESNTVDAGMDTMSLLTDILKPGGRSRFMVVDDDRLVGVIAL